MGIVAFEEQTDPDYHSAGMDIGLLSCCVGRGLGTETLRLLGGVARRRARPPPPDDRSRRRERPRDPRLREGRLPAHRRGAPLRARPRRDVARQPAHGHARLRARAIGAARIGYESPCAPPLVRRLETAMAIIRRDPRGTPRSAHRPPRLRRPDREGLGDGDPRRPRRGRRRWRRGHLARRGRHGVGRRLRRDGPAGRRLRHRATTRSGGNRRSTSRSSA